MTRQATVIRTGLFLLLAFFFVNGLANLVLFPLGYGADENDHLDYVCFLAYEQRLPDPSSESVGQIQHPPAAYAVMAICLRIGAVIDEKMGDGVFGDQIGWDIAGRRTVFRPGRRDLNLLSDEQIKVAREQPVDALTVARYELRDRVRYGLRFLSLMLGLATLLLLYRGLGAVLPQRPGYALLATAALVLTPHFAFHFATVSNDPWSTFVSTWIAATTLRAWRSQRLFERKTVIVLSILLGFAFLIKLHAIGIALFTGLFFLFAAMPEGGSSKKRRAVAILGLCAGPLLIAAWWHLRQMQLQDGILALAHHAEHAPHLLRLEPNSLAAFDFLSYAATSFFCDLGQDEIKSLPIYYLGTQALLAGAALGSCLALFAKSNVAAEDLGGKTQETATLDPGARLPLFASLAAILLLGAAIIAANQVYYHLHGRYFYAVLLPVAIALALGFLALCGRRAAWVLAAFCLWTAGFSVFTTTVVIANRYSVPSEKFDRGVVALYADCGHGLFDQAGVGGFSMQRGAKLLARPEDSFRHAPQVIDKTELSYHVDKLDPARRYQVRLRYPSPGSDVAGDVPGPSASVLIGDGFMIHGPHSLWNGVGELRFPLPREMTADGELRLYWENYIADRSAVACAELWVEQAWIQLDGDPKLILATGGKSSQLRVRVRNIDPQEHHAFYASLRDETGPLGNKFRFKLTLGPNEKRELNFDWPNHRAARDLKLQIVDADWSPQVDLKLSWYGLPSAEASLSGRLEVPDIRVLRCRPKTPIKELARIPLPRLRPGRYRFGITHVGKDSPFASGKLDVISSQDLDRKRLVGWKTERCRLGRDLWRSYCEFEKTVPGETDVFFHLTTGAELISGSVDLDRLSLWRLEDHPRAGHLYDLGQ
ncbi:MAG: hypothetical protein V3W41_03035 [Planctomycetota bacterium]